MPTLYVLAGPNGAGKTTAFKELVPEGTDYINADLIAKDLREQAGGLNIQEIANAQASIIFEKKIKAGETFSIETNLVDVETYNSFINAQLKHGYQVNLIFLTVDDVNICINRVAQRVREGGHDVSPQVIKDRYVLGKSLLAHYKDFPDQTRLLDNTHGGLTIQAVLHKGVLTQKMDEVKPWVSEILSAQKKSVLERPASVEAARQLYEQKKNKGSGPTT